MGTLSWRTCGALLCLGLVAAGCADFYTVSRRTTLPASQKSGLAIHLDAQQRLVIYSPDGTYCAEASPDAMAAYAAAVALGASAPGYGAGSGANASQSNAASIGLRTQSITLMRDALYRLCEATANDTVSSLSATQLLARSQDLTAVVVAVEQLTGAVAANQAILTGASSSDASASLVSDAELLDSARANETRKKENLASAKEGQRKQADVVKAQELKFDEAKGAHEAAAKKSPAPDNLAELEGKRNLEEGNLSSEKSKLAVEDEKVKAAEKSLEDASQVVKTIESKNSAALTSASAATSGSGRLSAAVPRIQLDKGATEAIAESVNNMVVEVLKKDYTIDACMTLMTNPKAFDNLTETQADVLNLTLTQCRDLLEAKISKEISEASSSFEPDDSTELLLNAMKDPIVRQNLRTWVRAEEPDLRFQDFLYDPGSADLRARAVTKFGL